MVVFCLGIDDALLKQLVVSYQKKFFDILVVDLPMKELYKSDDILEDLSVLLNSQIIDEVRITHIKDIHSADLGTAHLIKQNFFETKIVSNSEKSK